MGSKKDLQAELEALRVVLARTETQLSRVEKWREHWMKSSGSCANEVHRLRGMLAAERAKPKFIGNTITGDFVDKKIIENQKQTILELHKQLDALETAKKECDYFVKRCNQLKDELAELKAKQSPFALAIPESYKLKAKDQEIRELNLYITRLTGQLDNIRLAAR